MRGIERVITGILLAVAVCGSAAFARSVGRDAAGGGAEVQLVAAPPQHAQSPRGVQVPLYPLLTDRKAAKPAATKPSKPSLSDIVSTPAAAPAHRIVVARPAVRRHSLAPSTHAVIAKAPIRVRPVKPAPVAQPHAPAAAPAATPPPGPTPAPAPRQESDSRILAKVPLSPAPTWAHVKGGPGRLKSHPDGDGPDTPAQQPAPSPSSTPTAGPTITILVVSPGAQHGPDNGNGNSGDNGNGHGHAYGRLKQGQNDHD